MVLTKAVNAKRQAQAEIDEARRLLDNAYKGAMQSAEGRAKEIQQNSEVQAQKNTAKDGENKSNISYSFRKSTSGTANDLLLPYSEELKDFISRRGDYIVNDFEGLKKIVNIAFDNAQKKATVYFGIIPVDVMAEIEKRIPNLPKELNGKLFKEGKDYSVAATLDSIRHLADEKALSREDIIDYLDRMADTIVEFDTVNFNYYVQGSTKNNGLIFKKTFEDGTIQSFEIISNKKRAMNLQTMYMEKGDYEKKKFAETMLMDNPSADVQDAGRSNFNNSISQNLKSVKQDLSLKGGIKINSQTPEMLDTIEELQNGDKSAADRLAKYVDNGMISTEAYKGLIEKYGAIPKGENPHRDIQVPKKTADDKKVSQTVRTILEAKATPDEAVPTIEKMVGLFINNTEPTENCRLNLLLCLLCRKIRQIRFESYESVFAL